MSIRIPPCGQSSVSALALILFMVAVPEFTFFISPLFAQLSRKHEFEADAYAVSQTRNGFLFLFRAGHHHPDRAE